MLDGQYWCKQPKTGIKLKISSNSNIKRNSNSSAVSLKWVSLVLVSESDTDTLIIRNESHVAWDCSRLKERAKKHIYHFGFDSGGQDDSQPKETSCPLCGGDPSDKVGNSPLIKNAIRLLNFCQNFCFKEDLVNIFYLLLRLLNMYAENIRHLLL